MNQIHESWYSFLDLLDQPTYPVPFCLFSIALLLPIWEHTLLGLLPFLPSLPELGPGGQRQATWGKACIGEIARNGLAASLKITNMSCWICQHCILLAPPLPNISLCEEAWAAWLQSHCLTGWPTTWRQSWFRMSTLFGTWKTKRSGLIPRALGPTKTSLNRLK